MQHFRDGHKLHSYVNFSSFFQIFPVSDKANNQHIVKGIIIFSIFEQLDDISFAVEPHIYI